MRNFRPGQLVPTYLTFASLSLAMALVACGGNGAGSEGESSGFGIGGTVLGLSSDGLVLRDRGGSVVAVAAGATEFSLPGRFLRGSEYAVTVDAQPSQQDCLVGQGTGTVVADVGNVVVSCGPIGPLTVTQIEPADMAVGVARDARPTLVFSRPIEPPAAASEVAVLESDAGSEVPAMQVEGARMTLSAAHRLLPLTEHRVRVSDAIVGLRGERLAGEVVRRFTTADGDWRDAETAGPSEQLDVGSTLAATDRAGNAMLVWLASERVNGTTHQIVRTSRFDAAAAVWGSPMTLSDVSGNAGSPHVVMDDAGNGVVAWQFLPDGPSPRRLSIRAIRFHRASGQWGPVHQVSNTAGDAFWPEIAARSNGDVALAWVQRSPGAVSTGEAIWMATATGEPDAMWSSPERVDDPAAPDMVVGGEIGIALSPLGHRAAVVWPARPVGPNAGPYSIWARVIDGTTSGSQPSRVISTQDGDDRRQPQVAIDGRGDVHVAWRQDGPSTTGGVRRLWTVRHGASGWSANVPRSGPLDLVETFRLATNRAREGVSATWISWSQATPGDQSGRIVAARLDGDAVAPPREIASGITSTGLRHEMVLAVDPSGHAIAAWVQGSSKALMAARYSAWSDDWGAPRMLGVDTRALAARGLAISASGDALLAWKGPSSDGTGVGWVPRVRRFE